MSLLKKVKELNNFSDKNKFVNLICNGDCVGLVHKKIANFIIESKLAYFFKNDSLILKSLFICPSRNIQFYEKIEGCMILAIFSDAIC